ncbi:hypothetical protein AHiyo8_49420 [Arthrobacter sp. Hiyo8]|nr:hypothetical protein AHiyo8_49420 [Arthrobacter sp. Hiyo8]
MAVADVARAVRPEAFKDEQGMRIVCGAPMCGYLKRRPGGSGLIAYVELVLPEDNPREMEEGPSRWRIYPVLGVAMGPAPYPTGRGDGCVRGLLRSGETWQSVRCPGS